MTNKIFFNLFKYLKYGLITQWRATDFKDFSYYQDYLKAETS